MSDRIESFVIEQSRPGERLDAFLRERFAAVSRGTLQRLIEQGYIRVNGQPVKPTHHAARRGNRGRALARRPPRRSAAGSHSAGNFV